MLQTLSIKNVALIKDLTIDFNKGFNVLLGETGAGKSIIFDALTFVIGGKADKDLIRHGETSMRADAVFNKLSRTLVEKIVEFGIEVEDEVVLSRALTIDGKSMIRVNGYPVTLSILKQIGTFLVDIYSQHESSNLLNSKNHLAMLDKFGGQELKEIKSEVEARFERYKSTLQEINELGGDEFERERTKSLLDYQIKEIENANIRQGELELLKEKLNLMSSAEKICESVSLCCNLLDENSASAIALLHESENTLAPLSKFENIEELKTRLASAKYEIQDIVESLELIKDSSEFSQSELDEADRRLDLVKGLCRKYGGDEQSVINYLNESKERLNRLTDAEFELARLEGLKKEQEKALQEACESLSNKRHIIASKIEGKVVSELAELGMKNTRFVVDFNRISNFSANGFDEASFSFSANVGQDVKALSKTASGGEMSRFMLAFKNIFAEIGSAETLVFDEIDSGISGETGYIVGEKINKLTTFSQVICITHLPQVASYGDNFYFVSKRLEGDTTVTNIEILQGEKVLYNLARLISGDDVTEIAISHAKEMRTKANKA